MSTPVENEKPGLLKRDWHETLRGWITGLLSGPFLPKSMLVFYVLEVLTFTALALMSQPLDVWKDSSLNTLGMSPWAFILLEFFFLVVGVLALIFINYRPALVGWVVVCSLSLRFIGNWLELCNFSRWFPWVTSCMNSSYAFETFGLIVMGILLAANFLVREPAAAEEGRPRVRVPTWMKLAAVGLWIAILLGGLAWSAWKPSTGWVSIDIPADKLPGPRSGGAIVYDTQRQRAVLFGGVTAWMGNAYQYSNETWEWDGKAWIKMNPAHLPSSRSAFGMAYDEKRGVTVLYGGEASGDSALSDTWEWDGKDWTLKNPQCCPCLRAYHRMVYDPVRGKVVLYGGTNNNGKFYSDGWEWDGTNWQQITFAGQTPAASSFVLVYDPAHEDILGFLSGSPGGTWSWKGNEWNRLSPATEPSNRGGAAAAYDPSTQKVYLFGGWENKTQLNDTWVFDGAGWTEYKSAQNPPILTGAMMFYDPLRKHIVLFGGYGQDKYYNQMWELVLAN